MKAVEKSVLDNWIKEKYFPTTEWNREQLKGWQLERIQEIFSLAKGKSPFYRKIYRGIALPEHWADFRRLPAIGSEAVKRDGGKMLCVSQREIARAVTLDTSGTTDKPKRLFFTEEEQELTVDFFAHGMRELAEPKEVVAVCLPYRTPGCVGDLLIRGLERQGIAGVGIGIIQSLKEAAEKMTEFGTQVAVGIPVQILGIMEYAAAREISLPLRRILTSTDTLPRAVRQRLEQFGLEVYDHFGMTECGLGAAIECGLHCGMHIRENDLFMEILDADGNQVEDGVLGELAVTTLTRRGMPLIRYRTGDIARILPGVCGCGSILRRLEPAGRLLEIRFQGRTIRELDEYFFSFPKIVDYQIEEHAGRWNVQVYFVDELSREVRDDLEEKAGIKAEISYLEISDSLPEYKGKRRLMREEEYEAHSIPSWGDSSSQQ